MTKYSLTMMYLSAKFIGSGKFIEMKGWFIMFPRIDTYKKKSKVYQYLVISESIRKNKESTTRDIARLGNISKFKKYDIENIIDGLIRIFKLDKYALSEDVEILESLSHGSVIFWQKLWRDLKLSSLIRQEVFSRHPGLSLAVDRYVEMMVINRCVNPESKLGVVSRWLPTTSYKELSCYGDLSWDVNYFYRSMDYLIEVKEELESGIFKRLQNLFSVNIKLTFYDITSTFLYGEHCSIAEPGYSRDMRPDCDQIVGHRMRVVIR